MLRTGGPFLPLFILLMLVRVAREIDRRLEISERSVRTAVPLYHVGLFRRLGDRGPWIEPGQPCHHHVVEQARFDAAV